MLNWKAAHGRYTIDLAKNKENQAPNIPKPACEKRKLSNERILDAKRQKITLESCNEKMEEDADKYFVDAEKDFITLNFWKQETSFKKWSKKTVKRGKN